jgi:hypothetical protein
MSAPVENIYKSLDEAYGEAVIKAFHELLETKHLYQFVNADLKEIETITERIAEQDPHGLPQVVRANIKDGIPNWTKKPWILISGPIPPITSKVGGQLSPIELQSVKLSCSSCNGAVWPHNPGYRGSEPIFRSYDYSSGNSNVQFFHLSFQCQNCKSTPLVFLVKREDLKLSLVGRSQFPEVSVPDFIPDAQRKFYRNAIIADQTSFTLAAALYLRTVIEQYFHATIPEVEIKAIKGNPTGDELADLYAKTLPKNFPANFPSLKKAYNDLSEIVHSGKENDEVKKSFLAIRTAIDAHFKAVQLFKQMPKQ